MVDFLVTLGLVCVLPFVLGMFEVWMKGSSRAIDDESAGAGRPTPVQQRTIVTVTPAFTSVMYPKGLTGRWSHAGTFSGPSEGASLDSELALNEIWLPPPPSGERTDRTVVPMSTFQQYRRRFQLSMSRPAWIGGRRSESCSDFSAPISSSTTSRSRLRSSGSVLSLGSGSGHSTWRWSPGPMVAEIAGFTMCKSSVFLFSRRRWRPLGRSWTGREPGIRDSNGSCGSTSATWLPPP